LLKINGAKEMAELAGGSIDLPGGFSLPIPSGLVVRARRATCLLGAPVMHAPVCCPSRAAWRHASGRMGVRVGEHGSRWWGANGRLGERGCSGVLSPLGP